MLVQGGESTHFYLFFNSEFGFVEKQLLLLFDILWKIPSPAWTAIENTIN